LAQESVQCREQLDAVAAAVRDAEVGERLAQDVVERQLRIRDVRGLDPFSELAQERVEEGRLPHPDLAHHDHDAAAPLETDLQSGERFGVPGTRVEECRVGRERERFGPQVEVVGVHRNGDASTISLRRYLREDW
jgi:hypothetical protein